ncbi:hypothetical protein FXO37_05235 [Capsicum annuum]|nr:hypothetical protein FXO37_05235 [Capsicum annuum]
MMVVFITMFLDFNIPLADPHLMKELKVQAQILDARQDRDADQATLHYQVAWCVQNHDMNLLPSYGKNSLFLTIDVTEKTTECNKIPRNISGEELVSIYPTLWVTKYEKLRAHAQPLRPPDDSDYHYLKRPPKIAFNIPMYNPSYDFSDVKDPDTILKFLTGFMR